MHRNAYTTMKIYLIKFIEKTYTNLYYGLVGHLWMKIKIRTQPTNIIDPDPRDRCVSFGT